MAINYTTKTNPKRSTDKKELGYQLIFFALNFLAVPFSAYQTYMGYRDVAGGVALAAILAGLSGVLFFGLNYIIMDRRKNGQPHYIQTLGYLLPLSLSFFGNFNAFYCNNTGADSVTKSIAIYEGLFQTTVSNGNRELVLSTELDRRSKDKNNLLDDLEQQIKNGWGTNCNDLWDKLQVIQPTSEVQSKWGAQCKSPNHTIWVCNDYFKDCKGWYNKVFEKDSISRYNVIKFEMDTIYNLSTVINSKYKNYKSISAITQGALKRTQGEVLIEEIRVANNYLGNLIQAKVPGFSFEMLEPKSSVCTIGDSVHSAFIERNEPTQSFLALFFSLIIDLITLGFIFLAFSYNPSKRPLNNGPRAL